MNNIIRQKVMLLLAGLFLLGVSACSGLPYDTPSPTSQGSISIHSDFRDLYQSLGGEKELGPAISPPFNQNGIVCQFTTNVLMCYNPAALSDADRLYLAPIGNLLDLHQFTGTQIGTPVVYEGFEDFYHNKFFGARYVGEPLTGIQFNLEKHRLEQYFEKMGFYILQGDPQPTVHLLAYGISTCGDQCANDNVTQSGIVGLYKGTEVLNPLSIARIGDYALFGNPLTNPYFAADGNLEQVLEKVVVYVPKDNPATVRLRTLAAVLKSPLQRSGAAAVWTKRQHGFLPGEWRSGLPCAGRVRQIYYPSRKHGNFRKAPGRAFLSGGQWAIDCSPVF